MLDEYELLCRISVTAWISMSFLFFLVGILFCLEIILEISLCVQVDDSNEQAGLCQEW